MAGSPFTIRDTTVGGMAGFPQLLAQSGEEDEELKTL